MTNDDDSFFFIKKGMNEWMTLPSSYSTIKKWFWFSLLNRIKEWKKNQTKNNNVLSWFSSVKCQKSRPRSANSSSDEFFLFKILKKIFSMQSLWFVVECVGVSGVFNTYLFSYIFNK